MSIRKLVAVIGLLIAGLTAGTASAQTVQLESVNFPGKFIRHQYSLGVLTSLGSPLDFADASFVLRPALSGAPGAASYESLNYPGHFLRHQGFRIKLSQNDGSDLFRQDASFLTRSGLADPGATSLESINFPGHFIRHQNFELWLVKNDGSGLFAQDVSFRQMQIAAAAPPAGGGGGGGQGGATIATVTADVDVYNKPGGTGKVTGVLTAGTQVGVGGSCNKKAWCDVQGGNVPNGYGWVWGEFLTF